MADQFLDVTSGGQRLAAALRRLCEELAERSPDLAAKELATELLAGRVQLRDAPTSLAYRDLFDTAFQQWIRWQDQATPEQKAEANEQARTFLDAVHNTESASEPHGPGTERETAYEDRLSTLSGNDLLGWLTSDDPEPTATGTTASHPVCQAVGGTGTGATPLGPLPDAVAPAGDGVAVSGKAPGRSGCRRLRS